jgi:ketosteroid isomerase-like protein
VRDDLADSFVAVDPERLELERPADTRLPGAGLIGDRIVVPFHVRARGKGSGAEVERRWVHVRTFRDGKAVMFEAFMNKEAALLTLGGN